MNHLLKVAVIQQKGYATKNEALEHAIGLIEQAAKAGAQVIVLPELHNGLYFCQSMHPNFFEYAERIPGSTTSELGQVAKTLKVVLVASVFECCTEGVYYNTAVVIDCDGRIAGRYRKMHIPDDPGFHEKYYFTPGNLGFTPIKTSVGSLGVLVCWDQWYPEAARLMALAGAQCLLYPTAIGWVPGDFADERDRQLEAWRMIQRAHAVANHLPVAVANRVGFEARVGGNNEGLTFWGNSFMAGPQGELLAQADEQEETFLLAVFDKNRTKELRRQWPFLRDRRIDAYQDLLERYLESPI